MDILDEVLQNVSFRGGKSGFNRSDVNIARRMITDGATCDAISRAVRVKLELVEAFVARETGEADVPAKPVRKPDEHDPSTDPVIERRTVKSPPKLAKKKTAKKKVKKKR